MLKPQCKQKFDIWIKIGQIWLVNIKCLGMASKFNIYYNVNLLVLKICKLFTIIWSENWGYMKFNFKTCQFQIVKWSLKYVD